MRSCRMFCHASERVIQKHCTSFKLQYINSCSAIFTAANMVLIRLINSRHQTVTIIVACKNVYACTMYVFMSEYMCMRVYAYIEIQDAATSPTAQTAAESLEMKFICSHNDSDALQMSSVLCGIKSNSCRSCA